MNYYRSNLKCERYDFIFSQRTWRPLAKLINITKDLLIVICGKNALAFVVSHFKWQLQELVLTLNGYLLTPAIFLYTTA